MSARDPVAGVLRKQTKVEVSGQEVPWRGLLRSTPGAGGGEGGGKQEGAGEESYEAFTAKLQPTLRSWELGGPSE